MLMSMVWITCIYCQKWQIKRLTWLDTNFSKSLKANVNLKFSILKLFQLIVFNLKEDWYFCCYSWLSKNSSQNSFELNFFLKWCCKISIMQFYKLFKKIIWKDIYIDRSGFSSIFWENSMSQISYHFFEEFVKLHYWDLAT